MEKKTARSKYLIWALFMAVSLLFTLTTLQAMAQDERSPLAANLVVSKEVNQANAEPGDVLTYTVAIQNTGDEATTAWLTDSLPVEVDYVGGSLDADFGDMGVANDVITWTGTVAGFQQIVHITFTAQITTGIEEATIINTAEVTGTGSLISDTAQTDVNTGPYLQYLPVVFHNYPPVLTLNSISDPEEDNVYTVSWGAFSGDYDRYVLQESTSASFASINNQWTIVTNHWQTINKGETGDTFYYRVRVDNDTQWGEGPWSNIQSITTVAPWSYSDNFSDYQSGWPREWSTSRGALYEVRPNEHPDCPGDDCPYDGNGYLIARRSGGTPRARFGPGEAVPSNHYRIEYDARWWDTSYYATYQVFFGSSNAFQNPDDQTGDWYAMQVRYNSQTGNCEYAVVRHYATRVVEGDAIRSIETTDYLQYWQAESTINCSARSTNSSAPWNHYKITRNGSDITVVVNGKTLGTWVDGNYGADLYFGVGATLYEGFTPSKPEFDNWTVELLD